MSSSPLRGPPPCICCTLRRGYKPVTKFWSRRLTAFPSIEPMIHVGAKPVFCDIDDTYTIDPEDARRKITKKTVGILPVHLYGRPANIDAFRSWPPTMASGSSKIAPVASAPNGKANGPAATEARRFQFLSVKKPDGLRRRRLHRHRRPRDRPQGDDAPQPRPQGQIPARKSRLQPSLQ